MSYVPLIYGISATYLWVRFVLTMGKVARNYEVSATYIQPHRSEKFGAVSRYDIGKRAVLKLNCTIG